MLRHDDRNAIRVLTLDRPPVNALNSEMLTALADALDQSVASDVAGVVLAGGDGMFSAGLDLPELVGLDRSALESFLGRFFDVMETLASVPVPVVAAITGHCPAGGTVLSLFCDYRVMASGDFVIGLNEVRVGIPMPRVVADLAVRTLGSRRAELAVVAGRLYDPSGAVAIGFVDEVVPPGQVVERAVAWARDLVGAPSFALAATRSRMRSDLLDLVRRHRGADVEWLADAWFRPEVQDALRDTVRRLTERD